MLERLKESRGKKETYIFPLQSKEEIAECPIEDQVSQSWLLIGMRGTLKFQAKL